MTFCVYELSREPLNGFVPNSPGKTCSILLSDEFEDQHQRSKVKVTRDKKIGFSADISRTAERICDKFTRKKCLIPRSDEFEGQGQFRRPACGLCLEKHLCSSVWATLTVVTEMNNC